MGAYKVAGTSYSGTAFTLAGENAPMTAQPSEEAIRKACEEAWDIIARERGLSWATANASRFTRLLDAEAWLDAAMMLLPEGWRVNSMGEYGNGMGDLTGQCYASINPRDLSHLPYTYEAHVATVRRADGPTIEDALLAAIEKARTV